MPIRTTSSGRLTIRLPFRLSTTRILDVLRLGERRTRHRDPADGDRDVRHPHLEPVDERPTLPPGGAVTPAPTFAAQASTPRPATDSFRQSGVSPAVAATAAQHPPVGRDARGPCGARPAPDARSWCVLFVTRPLPLPAPSPTPIGALYCVCGEESLVGRQPGYAIVGMYDSSTSSRRPTPTAAPVDRHRASVPRSGPRAPEVSWHGFGGTLWTAPR